MTKNEALYFLECLAKGLNPFNGEKLENESIFNDVNMVRALYEIRNFMDYEIKNKKTKKEPFTLLRKEGIVDGPMNISTFVKKINEVNSGTKMKKFNRKVLINWLIQNDYLFLENGKKRITNKGKNSGIYVLHRVSNNGKAYDVITYPEKFLNYILELIGSGKIV